MAAPSNGRWSTLLRSLRSLDAGADHVVIERYQPVVIAERGTWRRHAWVRLSWPCSWAPRAGARPLTGDERNVPHKIIAIGGPRSPAIDRGLRGASRTEYPVGSHNRCGRDPR